MSLKMKIFMFQVNDYQRTSSKTNFCGHQSMFFSSHLILAIMRWNYDKLFKAAGMEVKYMLNNTYSQSPRLTWLSNL